MLFKAVTTGVQVNRKEDEKGLQMNTSIETIDFSDNDLTCEHGKIICQFLKKQSEVRDLQLWEISLRQRQVEDHLK